MRKPILLSLLFLPALLLCDIEEDFSNLKKDYKLNSWNKVIFRGDEIFKEYTNTVYSNEIYYYQAVSYFQLKDYDLANQYFTKYLSMDGSARHLQTAIEYKYKIAEMFEEGYYGHMFGMKGFPRIESMWDTAFDIYTQVIKTIPRSDIAAKSLFAQGRMLRLDHKFDKSVTSYKDLIRRFPKSTLAEDAYIEIAKTYVEELKHDYLDEKKYQLALINEEKFLLDYPLTEKKQKIRSILNDIEDVLAENIYKSSLYFRKKDNKQSEIMYLNSMVIKYPNSKYAPIAVKRLEECEVERIISAGQ